MILHNSASVVFIHFMVLQIELLLMVSGVARILKLPGHSNCTLPKAAHRGV